MQADRSNSYWRTPNKIAGFCWLATLASTAPLVEGEWIGAAGDYVELHVSGRCHLFRETMASLERRLDPAKFIRIHRSRIIQVANIVELQSIDNREFTVKVSDGSEHRASRTYADRLERWLSSGRT